MTKLASREIKIPAPKFTLHDLVYLHWNDAKYRTRVVRRFYDPDKGEWSYGVAGSAGMYSSDSLEARDD